MRAVFASSHAGSKCGSPHQRPPMLTARPVRTSRAITCNAAYSDHASDSEGEGSMFLDRTHFHALPDLEHASDDDGLLPMRHPGSFPYAGESNQSTLNYIWSLSLICSFLGTSNQGETTCNTGVQTEAEHESEVEAFDPLRGGPLRYLGYSNELGEAFAAWLPSFGVPASYCVALGYVLVDTYDKARAAHSGAQAARGAAVAQSGGSPADVDWDSIVTLLTSERAVDTLLWQVLASVVIPGFTIHQVVYLMHVLLDRTAHLGDSQLMPAATSVAISAAAQLTHSTVAEVAAVVDKMIPTLAGLAAIPLIVHPIDNAVHMLLNTTLRPYMRNVICDGAHGSDAGLQICEVPLYDDVAGEGELRGPAVSSFDYGSCLEEEGCSVVAEYYRHSGDAKPRNLKLAFAKAALLTSPVAWALLATQSL